MSYVLNQYLMDDLMVFFLSLMLVMFSLLLIHFYLWT